MNLALEEMHQMPIDFFPADDGVHVRQSFDSPTVYMDHWAIRLFSENLALQDRFVESLKSKGGTLLLSNISLSEFAWLTDGKHSLEAEAFMGRLLPNIFLTDFAFEKVLKREQAEANNERRFWPSADLSELKRLVELASDGPSGLTANSFFQMIHQHRIVWRESTESLISIIRDALDGARRDPDYVRKAKNAVLDERRARTTVIMGELMRGFNLDGNASISNNDVIDFLHAVMPVNCCDYVLLDGPWVDRVNKMSQRIAAAKMTMPIAKCFSKNKNGGIEAFLASLEAFVSPESKALM